MNFSPLQRIAEENADDHQDDEEDEPVIAPTPLAVVRAVNGKKRRRTNTHASIAHEAKNCLLCIAPLEQSHPEFYEGFYNVLREGLGQAQIDNVCDAMLLFFKRHVRPLWSELASDHLLLVESLSSEIIKDHLFHHTNDPGIEVYAQIMQYKALRDVALDHVVQTNADQSNVIIDEKLFKMIDKANTTIISLYKQKDLVLFKSTKLGL